MDGSVHGYSRIVRVTVRRLSVSSFLRFLGMGCVPPSRCHPRFILRISGQDMKKSQTSDSGCSRWQLCQGCGVASEDGSFLRVY